MTARHVGEVGVRNHIFGAGLKGGQVVGSRVGLGIDRTGYAATRRLAKSDRPASTPISLREVAGEVSCHIKHLRFGRDARRPLRSQATILPYPAPISRFLSLSPLPNPRMPCLGYPV